MYYNVYVYVLHMYYNVYMYVLHMYYNVYVYVYIAVLVQRNYRHFFKYFKPKIAF